MTTEVKDVGATLTTASGNFEPEQKRYLEGFVAGLQIAKTAKGLAASGALAAALPSSPPAEPVGPDAAALKAQDRVLKAGGKLSDPEKFKREEHPFDTYQRLKEFGARNEYPKPPDNFRWRFFGLFYVAPNQNAYMCRLRMPNGILRAAQLSGLADLAERYGGGYAHVTTRANVQIREIEAKNAVAMVEAILDLGLCSRGSGADNIRNVTGTPTAGIDPQELIDTRRVEKFLGLVEEKLGRKLDRTVPGALLPRPPVDRFAHVGIHPQKQDQLNWIGVVVPVGRLTVAQMRGLAEVAGDFGDGDVRLTVWQNMLISGVATANLDAAREKIEALGLAISTNPIRAGLVACTGNTGCKFAASDTKRHAEEIARWCEARVALDGPINIHLTGCHHSCAQHYIGDVGLLACKVQTSDDGDAVEGYHVFVGGGFGPHAALGRELYRDVKAEGAPKTVERMLKAYLAHRATRDETFITFARRHDIDALKALVEAQAV